MKPTDLKFPHMNYTRCCRRAFPTLIESVIMKYMFFNTLTVRVSPIFQDTDEALRSVMEMMFEELRYRK